MANNRAYMACPVCADALFLGKYYPTNWEFGSWTDGFLGKLNQWLFDHRHAHETDGQYGERVGHFPFVMMTEGQIGDRATTDKRGILDALSTALKKDAE